MIPPVQGTLIPGKFPKRYPEQNRKRWKNARHKGEGVFWMAEQERGRKQGRTNRFLFTPDNFTFAIQMVPKRPDVQKARKAYWGCSLESKSRFESQI